MRVLLVISILFLSFCSQLFGAVTPEERAEREARLTAHLHCFAEWVDNICNLSKDQQDQLNERIKQAVTKSQQAYQFPDFPNQVKTRQSRLYDYSPIRFVGVRGAAWGAFQAGLNDELLKILSKDQQKKYRAAIENRKQKLHDRFLAHVINTADRELFLTDQQKEAIKILFPSQLSLLEDGLFSFVPHAGYLNEKSIDTIVSQSSLGLNGSQAKWKRYLQRNREAIVLINAKSEDELQKKISAEIQKRMEKMKPALQLRIDYFSGQFQLDEQELHYLELAGKGTMIKLAELWRENAIQMQKENTKRLNQNNARVAPHAILPLVRLYGFDHHPIWENAVMKVLTDSAYEKRETTAQRATMNYLIALLDQELWLTSDQRTQIATIYQNVSIFDRSRYCQNINYSNSYDLSLLAAVLHEERASKMNHFLNNSQKAALAELQKQFQKDKNILTVKARRGQTFLCYFNGNREKSIQFFSRGGFFLSE